MRPTTIIIAGYHFDKDELQEIFDDFASTSPLETRTEAWLIAEAIEQMDLEDIERALKRLRLLKEVRALRRNDVNVSARRERRHPDSIVRASRSPESRDRITSDLIRAILREVVL